MPPDLLLRAPRLESLGVRHGFSTRGGGVSVGPYASLNLGGAVGDDPGAVAENRRRFSALAGVAPLYQASQVHGTTVLEVTAGAEPGEVVQREADALVARQPGTAVGVRTADCMPILLADPETGAVAAVHAGWRGTLDGIARVAAEALAGPGATGRLVGALGPSIRACCYEVSDDLARRFAHALGDETVRAGPRQSHLDLVEANLRVLESAGLPRERVDVLAACNACDPARFFSHRRDAGKTGRHVSFIVAFP